MLNTPMPGFSVARDHDRFDQQYGVGIGALSFKVATQDSHGALLTLEIVHHAQGGPARHLHYDQDEWFYVVAGEYIVEVGQEQYRLNSGDCAFGPRRVPHTWAHVGDQVGRIVFVAAPAGQLEAFLQEISKANAMAPQDPAFWRAYGMELVGPPLEIK